MGKGVTAERLRELLDYNPATGVFKWKLSYRMRRKGLVAGRRHGGWYWCIRVDSREYLAHRLAWLYVYGRWPLDQIDHINGIRFDNRIANLREATNSQNKQNRKPKVAGLKGVYRQKNRWRARITINRRCLYLGTFSTPEAASAAYREAAIKHFGEFARFA
jgi:hypothetical protein